MPSRRLSRAGEVGLNGQNPERSALPAPPSDRGGQIDLSVCVASFNTRDVLERTLHAAIADGSALRTEWIVVDNGSNDGSVQMVRRVFPGVTVIENSKNRFYAAATNQAIARSKGRYVLTLNSDAEVLSGTLTQLITYMNRHPEVGAVTTRMLDRDGRIQKNCARFPTYALLLLDHTFLGLIFSGRRRRLRRWAWYADWDRLTERSVDVAPGSFILARREAIRKVGGHDERFRLYFTDDDWCQRLRRAGYALRYVPVGHVIHAEGTSARQIQATARRIYFEDMRTFAAKYFGKRRARWLWMLASPTRWGLDLAARLRRR